MKCPIIATDVGGNKEALIDGQSGVLIPYGDSEKLAKAVENMVSDKARALELGMNARTRVEGSFSIEDHVDQMQRLYAELAKRK